MRAQLHLISPPWAPVIYPSTAIGALKAYVDRELGAQVRTHAYSAFLEIPYGWHPDSFAQDVAQFGEIGESLYMLIYWSRYLKRTLPIPETEIAHYVGALDQYCGKRAAFDWERQRLRPKSIEELAQLTEGYLLRKVVPELSDSAVNVIGFSTSFSQVYPSLVMARMLRELAPDKRFLFLYGGFSVSLPNIFALLSRLGTDGYVVLGEGEEKLVAILRDVLAQRKFDGTLAKPIEGVFRASDSPDLFYRDERFFRTSIANLDELPLPDYDEYFRLYKGITRLLPEGKPIFPLAVAVEGTRGCFGRCDFCNLNQQWPGFRKSTPDHVYEKVRALRERHGIDFVSFVDSVSDTYAEQFADRIASSGDRFTFYMSLRAHHMERFWAKLARAGMVVCQVGIEALSAPLLRHMNKGTTLVQNLRVLKHFTEYGVQSSCGLVTHHPRATAEDARETLRILDEISHLSPVYPNWYSVGAGSPLYDRYTSEQRRSLVPGSPVPFPEPLTPYIASAYYERPPQDLLPPDTEQLWTDVHDRARDLARRHRQGERPIFSVTRLSDGSLEIVDTRFERRETRLDGLEARLFDSCHEGLKVDLLERRLGTSRETFQTTLDSLVARRLVVLADGYYLTLATRPAAECYARLELEPGSDRENPAKRLPQDLPEQHARHSS